MSVKIVVYRNAETMAKNEPCIREFVEIEGFFDFTGIINAFKTIWPDCTITFNV